MKKEAENILKLLGLPIEDIEYEPEYHLLEDLLCSVDEENIISSEEYEMLESAEIEGLGEVELLDMLKKYGFEKDDLDVDNDDVQYLESKLSILESNCWDYEIHKLRNLQDKMEKIVQQLREKSYNYIYSQQECQQECETEWKQIDTCFDLLFRDFKELIALTENPKTIETLNLFLDNFKIEVDKFIEHASQYIEISTKSCGINLNTDLNNVETHQAPSSEEEILKSLCSLQRRLTSALYHLNLEYGGNEIRKLLQISDGIETPEDKIFSNDYKKYLASSWIFCEKWAEMQVKENVVLCNLVKNISQREVLYSSMNNLSSILQMQVDLNCLKSIAVSLWKQDHNSITNLLVECKHYSHQEIVNIVSRVTYLNELKREYELFFESDKCEKYTLFKKLKRLTDKHCSSAEDKKLRDMIEGKENQLCHLLDNQRLCVMNSKSNLLEIDKYLQEILQHLNCNLDLLSQVEEIYYESSRVLQFRKEEVQKVNGQLLEHLALGSLRLLWVYFLTDQKKLRELKEEVELNPLNMVVTPTKTFERSSSVSSTPSILFESVLFFTSTPGKDSD